MHFIRFAPFAVFLALPACGGQPSPPPQQVPQVGVVTMREEQVTLTTELPGRTAAYESSEVRPQVSGLITARLFIEGEAVRKGQALYRIDPQPYRQQVASARAALARSRAAIASSEALARRYGELVKINAISKQDYENATTAAQQAQADVAAQQAAVRTAQIDLGRTIVRAPIAGRIGTSVVTNGALVTAGQTTAMTTIQRLDPIYVDVTQSSADLLRLRRQVMNGTLSRDGMAARVRLKLEDGSIYPEEGALQFTNVSVDPTTGTQTIRALFANRAGLLLPGMYVTAQLVEGTQARALLVPQRAVSRDEKGRPTVLLVGAGDKAELRVITAPRTIGDKWLVTAGLKAGDRVIVEGAMMLRPGTPVKPAPWTPEAKPTAPAAGANPAASAQAK